MSDLVWEDPPPDGRIEGNSGRIQRDVEELQRHPGKWALVREYAWPNTASSYQAYGCEIATRQLKPGSRKVRVYARWPEQDAS